MCLGRVLPAVRGIDSFDPNTKRKHTKRAIEDADGIYLFFVSTWTKFALLAGSPGNERSNYREGRASKDTLNRPQPGSRGIGGEAKCKRSIS